MHRVEKKHPRAVRWMHWLNVPLLAVMIWSGLMILWANNVYRIGWGDVTLLPLFPDWFFEFLGLRYRLAEGMAWHFAFAWLFALNGLAYVLFTVVSGEWRHLAPGRHTLGDIRQALFHKRGPSRGPRKYNGAQQLAYIGVILMGAASVLTGLAILKPVQLAWLTALLGGYEWARWEHFWLVMGYLVFVVIHVTEVIRAGWNNFRGMVTGYELVPKEVDHE